MSDELAPLSISVAPAELAVPEQMLLNLERNGKAAWGAISANTARALHSDIDKIWTPWCRLNGLCPVPASPETVTRFIDDMAKGVGRSNGPAKPATLKRYLASIAYLHRQACVESPTRDESVKYAMKRAVRETPTRQRQAKGLTRSHLDQMLAVLAVDPSRKALRDRALLTVAYDSMARRSELVALNVEDVVRHPEGDGCAIIRRSKTDQSGEGSERYLAPDTLRILDSWLSAARITSGPIFRRFHKEDGIGSGRMSDRGVADTLRAVAQRAKLDTTDVSGHSLRVGAAQDQVAAGCSLPEIMQSGGWKSPTMPSRYAAHLLTRRSGAAKLAQMQGRV